MLRSESLFGKRENNTGNTGASTTGGSTANIGSGIGNNAGNQGTSTASGQVSSVAGGRITGVAGGTQTTAGASTAARHGAGAQHHEHGAKEAGNRLLVGPNIKLKGVEITDCEILEVEGRVEATMDSRMIEIAECGAFKGSAAVDIAEIRGLFEGDLTVRQKLVICATGRVSGTIRYGKLVVEEGGQLYGDVQVISGGAAKPVVIEKMPAE